MWIFLYDKFMTGFQPVFGACFMYELLAETKYIYGPYLYGKIERQQNEEERNYRIEVKAKERRSKEEEQRRTNKIR